MRARNFRPLPVPALTPVVCATDVPASRVAEVLRERRDDAVFTESCDLIEDVITWRIGRDGWRRDRIATITIIDRRVHSAGCELSGRAVPLPASAARPDDRRQASGFNREREDPSPRAGGREELIVSLRPASRVASIAARWRKNCWLNQSCSPSHTGRG